MKTQEEKAQSYEYIEKVALLISRIRQKPRPKTKEELEDDPDEFYPIVGADFPSGDGVRVWWQGIDHPTKTFPYKETLEKIDDIKKVFVSLLKGITSILSKNKLIALLGFFIFRKELEKTSLVFLQEISQILRGVKNEPEMFCRAAREVWRVFELEQSEERTKIRDLVCHIVEYDDAYRYPFQWVMVKLDKMALAKNPVKEIGRLLDLLSVQERSPVLKEKWQKVKKIVWLLKFKPKILKEVQRFLINLNLNELELDETDKYHAKKKEHFIFDF